MAISDVLLEGGLAFKTSRQEGGGFKILRFFGEHHLWMASMQNLMVMFTDPVFDRKYPSWANFVQIFKIVCSK